MEFDFPRWERLKKQKLIQQLFVQKQSIGAYPLRLFWLEMPPNADDAPICCQAAFAVPKKKFKRANRRNRIKRQMREIYRLNSHNLQDILTIKRRNLICLWFFAGSELPPFELLKAKMLYLLDKLSIQFNQ